MKKRIVVGRDSACDLVVDSEYVSPRHCQIVQDEDGRYWVEDMGSTNGTWVKPVGGSLFSMTRVYGLTPIPPGHRVCLSSKIELPWDPSH